MSSAANPRAPKADPSTAPRETTGPVAADSLAAESLHDNGGFAANEDAQALGVKGYQSTLNTTDTSSATPLAPAESGAARERQDARGAGADEKGAAGLKLDSLGKAEFSGRHSLQGYAGGPSGAGAAGVPVSGSGGSAKAGDSDFGASGVSSGGASGAGSGQVDENVRSTGKDFSGDPPSSSTTTTTSSSGGSGSGNIGSNTSGSGSSSGPSQGTGVRPHVDAAPTYTQSVTGSNLSSGTFKPKGTNLEDADVTQSIPETKTFTGDVGGVHDPGRLAERNFEGANTDPNVALGQTGAEGGGKQQGGGGAQDRGGQYDVLESERA